MDEFNVIHLASPPSSIQERLLSRHAGTMHSLPQSHLSSTPKTDTKCSATCSHLGLSHTNGSHRSLKNVKMQPNCESISDFHLTPIPNMNDSDNSEDEFSLPLRTRPKNIVPRFMSQSLPVTPRVNGNCHNHHQYASNGLPEISNIVHDPLGCANYPMTSLHLSTSHMPDISYSNVSIPGSTTQYVTCASSFADSRDKAFQGSIDYSSLPLPKENPVRIPSKKNISRFSSEPTISDTNQIKSNACPQRKSSLKSRKRDSKESYSLESPIEKSIRSSFNGIEEKLDDLEMVGTQWKFIRTLVDELNKCRNQNNIMAVQLHQAKLEIQMLKSNMEAHGDKRFQPGSLSELNSQIHAAQKVRDEVMMARITLANEERDAAYTQNQDLIAKFEHHEPLSAANYVHQKQSDGGLPNLEEEFRALRVAINLQESQDKQISQAHMIHELEDMKLKLSKSEISRYQLQERYSTLENVMNSGQQFSNGYHVAPVTRANAFDNGRDTRLTDASYDHSSNAKKECCRRESCSTSEGDQKNSLSSLDSVETISVSSWKKDNQKSCNSSASSNDGGQQLKDNVNNCKNAVDSKREVSTNTALALVGPITEL